MDLKELEAGIDPNQHWYYQSKKIALYRFFEKISSTDRQLSLIDFGAGSGFFAIDLYEQFPNRIDKVYLVDIGYSDEELKDTQGQVIQKVHAVPGQIADAVILFMDVLEHIEDDLGILREIKTALGDRIYYFITVPAFKQLWSYHDVYLEHYRRYTIKSMMSVLKQAGLKVDQSYYIFMALFPAAYIWRSINKNNQPGQSDMKPLNPIFNHILILYHRFEFAFRKLNKLFGLSCVIEGRF